MIEAFESACLSVLFRNMCFRIQNHKTRSRERCSLYGISGGGAATLSYGQWLPPAKLGPEKVTPPLLLMFPRESRRVNRPKRVNKASRQRRHRCAPSAQSSEHVVAVVAGTAHRGSRRTPSVAAEGLSPFPAADATAPAAHFLPDTPAILTPS